MNLESLADPARHEVVVRRLSGPVAGREVKARKPRAPTEDGPSNVYIPALFVKLVFFCVLYYNVIQ